MRSEATSKGLLVMLQSLCCCRFAPASSRPPHLFHVLLDIFINALNALVLGPQHSLSPPAVVFVVGVQEVRPGVMVESLRCLKDRASLLESLKGIVSKLSKLNNLGHRFFEGDKV